MAEVGAGHEVIAIAGAGEFSGAGTAVNGDVFAEGIVVPDGDAGWGGGIEAEVLGIGAEDAAGADGAVFAEGDLVEQLDMAGDAAALGAVHERACGGVERGRIVELEVGRPGEGGAARGCKGV